jgi:hypothetical protein
MILLSDCAYDLRAEKVLFQPLFKNMGEKLAFQTGDFSAPFSPMFKESSSGQSQAGNMSKALHVHIHYIGEYN